MYKYSIIDVQLSIDLLILRKIVNESEIIASGRLPW